MESVSKYTQMATEWVISSAPNFLAVLLILYIGLKLISKVTGLIHQAMLRSGLTQEIASFLATLATITFKVLLFISAASMIGINTTAFVGVLAAAGLAIGLALQGSLGNFAAGILIILFKPYRLGDWIEVGDKFGKVADIQIFTTVLTSPGNKTLVIPNGQIIDGVISNFSLNDYIRVDMEVLLSYKEDFPRVRQLLIDCLNNVETVLSEPAPEVGIMSYGDHNLILAIRPYAKSEDYWETYFTCMAAIKETYHINNIQIGYTEGIEFAEIGK